MSWSLIRLTDRSNQTMLYSGIDSFKNCFDQEYFLSYPYDISYNYNSQGFRDQEWPESLDELKNAIWCFGDSFTVGIGSPLSHTWPHRLSLLSKRRVINVSMDGASNNWISRISKKIINAINPSHIVIMWSFLHRRENIDESLSDESRRIRATDSSTDEDWSNFLSCQQQVNQLHNNTVEFTVPEFSPMDLTSTWNSLRGLDWPQSVPTTIAELDALPNFIINEMKDLFNCLDGFQKILNLNNVIFVKQQDLARDGYHFDLVTADWVAAQACQRLKLPLDYSKIETLY